MPSTVEVAIVTTLQCWTEAVKLLARLYLGANTTRYKSVLRQCVQHLNHVYNVELAMDPNVRESALTVLESITFQLGAQFDHYKNDPHMDCKVRLTVVLHGLRHVEVGGLA